MSKNDTVCLLEIWSVSNVSIVFLLTIINAIVIFGNLMVIVTVLFSRRLRNSNSNMLILSLACSDLFLGLIVLPFSTANSAFNNWIFGPFLCRLWLASDVWMCTASIYNLVIITVDRYIAVTRPLSYKTIVTKKKIFIMVSIAWILSLFIGMPLVFMDRQETPDCQCNHMVNNPSYIVTSSFVSFYVPFSVIIYFYCRIYRKIRSVSSALTHGFIEIDNVQNDKAAEPRGLQPKSGSESSPLLNSANRMSINLRIHRGGYRSRGKDSGVRNVKSDCTGGSSLQVKQLLRPRSQTWEMHSGSTLVTKIRHGGSLEEESKTDVCQCQMEPRLSSFGRRYDLNIARYQKRLAFELKALKTVGVVTGCFILCWFGFCLIYVLQALQNYPISDTLASVTTWLGYANSGINPFIYAACNRQYRRSFRNLIFRRSQSKYPPRSSSFSISAVSQSRRQSCLIEAGLEMMAGKTAGLL